MSKQLIISADSHVCEPGNLWVDRLDKQYRDRAPRAIKGYNGQPGEYFVCEDSDAMPVASAWGAGAPAEQLRANTAKGYESAPASVWDPAARLREQDHDGVSAEVLYATFGMFLFAMKDAGLRAACFRAYNDYIVEYSSHSPRRLIGTALITLEDIPAAVAELQRCAARGIRGAMICCAPHTEKPYSHSHYDGFWAAAQELRIALSLHSLTGAGGSGVDLNSFLVSYMAMPFEVQRTLADMVLHGVFERFPQLQIVSVENDVSWLPHFIYRLDHVYDRYRHVENLKLSLLPGEYLRRNVAATFQFEGDTAAFTRRFFGVEGLMWSSDYPHNDSTWPRSREIITAGFQDLPADDVQKIIAGNAARIYRL